jgi:GT2 family glycosyltransferase
VSKIRIAVLMACHNRRSKTLNCLNALYNQKDINDVRISVYLLDDGCTDGTGDAVRSRYPDVRIILGSGSTYWSAGMRIAFREATKEDYDYYLWLNDDTDFFPDTVRKLVDTSLLLAKQQGKEVIVAGTTQDRQTGLTTYGGLICPKWWLPLTFKLLKPTDKSRRCITMNGNCVLVPREVVKKVGVISSAFTQMAGDYDYGLRARRLGISCWIAPGYIGTCSTNPRPLYTNAAIPMKERLRALADPKEAPPCREWMIFAWRHAGFLWPLYWARTLVRIICPYLYVILKTAPSK